MNVCMCCVVCVCVCMRVCVVCVCIVVKKKVLLCFPLSHALRNTKERELDEIFAILIVATGNSG